MALHSPLNVILEKDVCFTLRELCLRDFTCLCLQLVLLGIAKLLVENKLTNLPTKPIGNKNLNKQYDFICIFIRKFFIFKGEK